MKKHFVLLLCLVFCSLCITTSCKDDDGTVDEYANWQKRNDAYYASLRTLALDSIQQANKQYGNAWREHCNWRTFLCYSKDSTVKNEPTDSIYVQIIKKGTGSGCPLSTDSCRIFYRGKLIPTDANPSGAIFTHTGQSTKFEEIFNTATGVPAFMRPVGTIKGFGTALQNMHIGDIWRVYIPYQLGYGSAPMGSIPAYSTLIYELQLVAYYRSGSSIPNWN